MSPERSPFYAGEITEMSTAISPATCAHYGVERVCRVWEQPRSTYYMQITEAVHPALSTPRLKRGPKTSVSDDELLEAIKLVINGSPFQGEGYKKIHASLHFGAQKLRVGRNCVLRLMRNNELLSPYRRPKADTNQHNGTIITDAPNIMWGTDGTQVRTVDDGNIWIFSAVEHWNGECVGIYVCKLGTRFNAVQPVLEGVQAIYGSVERAVANGLTLRLDNGSANCSDHFQYEIKRLGITPSFSYVQQPQTNGVVERFNRTLKEQVIYAHVFQNVDEVREAVLQFKQEYNRSWRLEKMGFKTPLETRQCFVEEHSITTAA